MSEVQTKEWFKRWFDSPYYDILYKERCQQEADTFIHNLIKYLNPAHNSFMLDLACGKGRHAISLGKMGFTVTGLDISERNIHIAEKAHSKNLSFYIHDMRKPYMANYYDYVFNLFTSFGYFDIERENEAVISNIYFALKPGGVFILDFVNIQKIANSHQSRCFGAKSHTEIEGIKFIVSRNLQNGFLIKNIEVFDGEQQFNFKEKVRAYSPEQLMEMTEKRGFEIIKQFGDYNLDNFEAGKSDRFILISKKK
ncbi:MAG: class I SAM-dependent methyltransferase [Bacteroidia bacterium]